MTALLATAADAAAPQGPSAPAPALHYAFSFRVELLPPIEQGTVDGRRKRFVPIAGGRVYGPRLQGEVLAGGGDWQTIGADGLTVVDTRYTIRAEDGTIIDVANPGVRTATPDVTEQMARGVEVAPDAYYFRTAPRFSVAAGPHEWLRRTVFVARGIRKPDHVIVDFYAVD